MNQHIVRDTAALTGRSLRHVVRSPDTIVTTTVMPVAFLLLFVYVFGGALQQGTSPYLEYMLPGILLITIASSVSYTAYRLFMDTSSGMVERLRSMPIARSAVLWAHVLTSLVATAVSLAVVVLVALLMGFRATASPAAWVAVAVVLALFTLALTWLAVVAGLSARTMDGAVAFSYPLIFLPFVSSAFVLTETMAAPVRAFAENQPVTTIVDAIRGLYLGHEVTGRLWLAVVWCVGLLLLGYAAALVAYRRKLT